MYSMQAISTYYQQCWSEIVKNKQFYYFRSHNYTKLLLQYFNTFVIFYLMTKYLNFIFIGENRVQYFDLADLIEIMFE